MFSPRQAREFQRIFKADLKKYDQGILGFDVTGFDDQVIKSGTQQMRVAVQQTYGTDGVRLVEELLGTRGA